MSGLELIALSKTFRNRVSAVDSVSLASEAELIAILGPSGSGKTTLLRLIAGLERPTSGEIHIANRLVNHVIPRSRGVAMLFQEPTLYPHLSVRANLSFAAELRGESTSQLWEAVAQAAEELELTSLLDRMPRELSGGERQRVALGRAIVCKPCLLLLDEPLAAVDIGLRLRLRQLVRQVHLRLNIPALYVTHDQEEALAMGDRVAVMHCGRIQQIATPQALYENPSSPLVAGLVGNPPMNLISGRASYDDGNWSFIAEGVRIQLERNLLQAEPIASQMVVMGIRPEQLTIALSGERQAGCFVKGRVRGVSFSGPTQLVSVEVGSVAQLLVRTPRKGLVVGQDCAVSFDQRDAICWPSGSESKWTGE